MLALSMMIAVPYANGALADLPLLGGWADDAFSAIIIALLCAVVFNGVHLYEDAEWGLMALTGLLGARYMSWRWLSTLNLATPAAVAISYLLYAAEVFGFTSLLLFYIQLLKPGKTRILPLPKGGLPSVDVFVTVYHEPVALLRRTLIGCQALDYPGLKTVYVLDDGRRKEVKELTEGLDCLYLERASNKDAKAGNINDGLKRSRGDLVMLLDCDHIPTRNFLEETVGQFSDPRVGFVHTPHYFYNSDAFQRGHQLENEVVNEQDLFSFVIQPGRDGYNSSFFAGSGGVFRRSALEKVGGMQTLTISEDLHTSMAVHAKGYKSVYVNKILSAGLSPETFRSYLIQRQRWTRGGLQIFILDNPLVKGGLSFMQRVNYFASNYYFLGAPPRMVFLLAPLSFLLFGRSAVLASTPDLLNHFLPFYMSSLVTFMVVSKGFRSAFWSDVYETATCFALSWTVLTTFLKPSGNRFHVTPKGEIFSLRRLQGLYVFPHVATLILLLIGLEIGGYRAWIRRDFAGAAGFSAIWACYNILILLAAIVAAEERPSPEAAVRLSRHAHCRIAVDGDYVLNGRTVDLSESGAGLSLSEYMPLPEMVKVRLDSQGESVEMDARVVRNEEQSSGRSTVGLRFLHPAGQAPAGLVRLIFCLPDSWHYAHHSVTVAWHAFLNLLTTLPRSLSRDARRWKVSARRRKQLPCELEAGTAVYRGVTREIGRRRVVMLMENGAHITGRVRVRLHHGEANPLVIPGRIVRRHKIKGRNELLMILFRERRDSEIDSLIAHHG